MTDTTGPATGSSTPPSPIITGSVVDADGKPVARARIQVLVRKPVAEDAQVGRTTTDTDGHFQVLVSAEPTDTVVVTAAKGRITVESAPWRAHPTPHQIDLILPTSTVAVPLSTQLGAVVAAHGPDLNPALLTPGDVSLLATSGATDPLALRALSESHQVAAQVGISPDVVFALVQQGVLPDPAAVAALSPGTITAAVAAAVVAGTVPAATNAAVAPTVTALARASISQPEFLVESATLYGTTSAVAAGTGDAATLLTTRFNRTLQDLVRSAIGPLSPQLGQAVDAALQTLDYSALAQQTISAVASDVLSRAATTPVLKTQADAAQTGLNPNSATVTEALALIAPVSANPVLADDLRRGKAATYARLAGLDAKTTRAVVSAPEVLTTTSGIDALVAGGAMTAAAAAKLSPVVDLATLTGDNASLIAALQRQGTIAPADLAGWTTAQWQSVLTTNVTLPPGETAASYAATLVRGLQLAYPTQALLPRVNDNLISTVMRSNSGLDLRLVDLTLPAVDTPALNWSGVPQAQQAAVTTQLQSYQRVMALTDDTDTQLALLNSGHTSALAITGLTLEQFTAASGLDPQIAANVHAAAQQSALQVSHSYAAIRDLVSDLFKNLAVSNIGPEVVNDLRRIEGFADLFGSQDYCTCDDCHSVLSAAAYFVDLMHFIEVNVSTSVFITPNLTNHPLYLKVRRPDLWTLQLTCDNTNTLIPYLTIVNEVLEAFLDGVVGTDIYTVLADPAQKLSFTEPFTLPWRELVLYLSHFQLAPADVYATLQRTDADVWRARTGLCPDEYQIVITADPIGVVSRVGNPASLANFPVQSFLRATGLSRAELDEVRGMRAFPNLAAITVTKVVTPDELQNFPEQLTGLTSALLDLIHRLVRLARVLGWSFPDLDVVLLTLSNAGLTGADIDHRTVEELGHLLTLQPIVRMPNSALGALVGDLPVSPSFPLQPPRTSDKELYEQLFDLPALFGIANAATGELNQTVTFHHYSLDTNNPSDTSIDPKTPLLLGGLGVTETELLLLMGLLKDLMPFDANGNCTLDRTKLSLLYRHVAVAQALTTPIDDLVRSLTLLFAAPDQTLSAPDRIETLATFRRWLGANRLDTAQLQLILGSTESPAATFQNTSDTTAALVQQVQAIAPTGRVDVLRSQLTGSLSISAAELADLETWLAHPLTDPAVAVALEATFTAGVPDNPAQLVPLTTALRDLERVTLLVNDLKLTAEDVDYITHTAAGLGIADLRTLTLANVQSLAFYRGLVALRPDGAVLVQAALDAYTAAGTVTVGPDRARIAELWQVDQSLIDSLVDVVAPKPVASDAFAAYAAVLAMCQVLGVNAYSLQIMGNDADFAALNAASDVALGCFSSKYADPSVRATTLEPYLDRINVLKRDALCDYIIARQPTLNFATHLDIYNYFLLDVDMSGCFRTSRVVAAISSAQLYVQRCLTDLEQSDPALSPPIVAIKVAPSRVPAVEWDWRKNYRVWEANRKVFLYPESYIDPTLRDDKTPAFEELEDTLLQQQVTKDSAEMAYEHYLTEFANLTHLRICGSLYDPSTNTYYFFGRTQQDPVSFYYRTWVDETTWTSWVKIDLGIEAPTVSAAIYRGRLYLFWVSGTTKDHTTISGGSSNTDYYTANVGLTYSSMTPEGKWLAPQKVDWLYPSDSETISAQNKIFGDAALNEMLQSKTYLRAYPHVSGDTLVLRYFNEGLNANFYFDRRLDLFHNKLRGIGGVIPALPDATAVIMFAQGNSAALGIETNSFGSELYFDQVLEQPKAIATSHTLVTNDFDYSNFSTGQVDTEYVMQYVTGGYPESVMLFGEQQFLIHDTPAIDRYFGLVNAFAETMRGVVLGGSGRANSAGSGGTSSGGSGGANSGSLIRVKRRLIRLSTSLADDLGEILMSGGLDKLLTLDSQLLHEKPIGITFTSLSDLGPPADDPNHLDLKGAFGGYYTELFLHIPWLIAHHLNAGNQFEDAKWWFDKFFDPTADSSPQDAVETDRVWRYVGFRNLTVPTLKQILTDSAAIAAYQQDPFNPHAIARLRPSAYQKATVMQYVDNLLDWGDSLFAQDTMESINEATMLYVLALEILGPRPVQLGDCDSVPDADLTYDTLGPLIAQGSEFLLQLETWSYVLNWSAVRQIDDLVLNNSVASQALASAMAQAKQVSPAMAVQEATRTDSLAGMLSAQRLNFADVTQAAAPPPPLTERVVPFSYSATVNKRVSDLATQQVPPTHFNWPQYQWPGVHVIMQSALVFCVPPNDVLLGYWGRVEDRLFKIRNCMNISGVRRSLALFAPEIDPMALVRARAAGLSLDDALAALAGPLPPYRFISLIDRARQAAQTVEGFGAALLAALEKKDVEQLVLLRSVHEQTILQMTTQVRTKQLEEAQDSLQAANDAMTVTQTRISYYGGLIDSGLNTWEITQQVLHAASVLDRIGEAGLNMAAAILYLVPQVGSPFAMKYGGNELGHSLAGFGGFAASMAAILEGLSAAAGSAAGYERRAQEWRQQLLTAQQELAQLTQQQAAASARVDIATQELAIHQTSIDQAAELDDFYHQKFTNLGLYDYLATSLNRTYRAAYNAAYELAGMAADAYRFEQDDDTVFLAPDNWQADKAGLLAGERLALQLQQMENAYLSGHTRTYEITQSFSLRTIAPQALVQLRSTGSCDFDLPEVLFDLAYPGQYKRLIKAARLTIPCVAGPFTNVSAKLSLTQSKVRKVATMNPGDLLLLPVRTTASIAASTAQTDSGMFEFSFRDERYLPFEGAGAVSSWRLELPAQLRAFDYDSMSDVILHVSYTALDDGVLRDSVEAQIVAELGELAASEGLFRLFSLRQDFPDAFALLMHQAVGAQSVSLTFGPQHFPYFASTLKIKASGATVYLEPTGSGPVDTTGLSVRLGTTTAQTWTPVPNSSLVSGSLGIVGPLTTGWTLSVPTGQLDPAAVSDVLLLVQYTAS